MSRVPRACVDMRAFSWRLLPLERKLAWERDAALGRLAQALAALENSQRQVGVMEVLQQEQTAAPLSRNAPDPEVHRHLLRYLGSLHLRLRQAMLRVSIGERAVMQARADCAQCERRLETLVAARDDAMRSYVRAGSLREDRQADAAWLMHDQYARSGRGVSP